MKRLKKGFSILMAAIMVLAMSIQAFADEGTGTITIENAIVGQTYKLYRMLDLESYNAEEGAEAYSYKYSEKWAHKASAYSQYLRVDDQGYVTPSSALSTEEGAKEFAKKAYSSINNTGDRLLTPDYSQKAEDTTVTFENLPLGYYLVNSSAGTVLAITTTNPDGRIEEKNEVPTLTKTVEEDSTNTYGDSNTADVGQEVNFKITITAYEGANNYIVHDKLPDGMDLKEDSLKVYKNGTEITQAGYYTVTTDELEDNCDFEIRFAGRFTNSIADKDEITVSYTAVVNGNAQIGTDGNENKAWMSYGENSTPTVDSATVTYVYKMDIFKFTAKKDEDGVEIKNGLSGAVFTLSRNEEGTDPIKLSKQDGSDSYIVDEENGSAEVTTPEGGKLTVSGLDADTYYLTEVKAPDGYNKLAAPITIVIDDEGAVTVEGVAVDADGVGVENKTGVILPSTGGIGVTAFYAAGILLMAGAVFAETRKRS